MPRTFASVGARTPVANPMHVPQFEHLERRQLFAVTQMDREAAVENARVLTNRYKAQMSLLKDVLQAQSELEQATNQGRQALLSFWTAKADFETAIGEDK